MLRNQNTSQHLEKSQKLQTAIKYQMKPRNGNSMTKEQSAAD